MLISETEKLDIESAITKAENKTSAEIVAVIARASAGYYYIPYMWGALIALAAPWPFIHWTWMPVQTVYIIQLPFSPLSPSFSIFQICGTRWCRAASCEGALISAPRSNSWRRTSTQRQAAQGSCFLCPLRSDTRKSWSITKST